MSWIQTYTGKKFDVRQPRPEDVCWLDIAHSLAQQCRFNGHTKHFYSVAQHCYLMSLHIPPQFALYALLHDAAEAYIGDMPEPVKQLFPEFTVMEDMLLSCIYKAAGIPEPSAEALAAVKEYDLRMLLTEKQQLLGESPEPWLVDGMGIEPMDIRIGCEPDFEIYKGRYLRRLVELGVPVDVVHAEVYRKDAEAQRVDHYAGTYSPGARP